MKSRITKEWFLILLVSVLALYTSDALKWLVSISFTVSEYKHPAFHLPYHILKIAIPIIVWYMLFTHHAKLLFAVKLLLLFMMITYSAPYLYFAGKYFFINNIQEATAIVVKSLFYFGITI